MTHRLVLVVSLVSLMSTETAKSFAVHQQSIKQFMEVPNKFRYAKIVSSPEIASPTIEQLILDYEPRFADKDGFNKYQIKRKDLSEAQTVFSGEGALDNEDKSLLDKFYRETRNENPFRGSSMVNIEDLWDEQENEKLSNVLVDLSAQRERQSSLNKKPQGEIAKTQNGHNEWTIDPQLLSVGHMEIPVSFFNSTTPSIWTISSNKIASYSPIHRLLTSYDPIGEHLRAAMNTNQERGNRENRVVGATLYARDQSIKPLVDSKSSKQAIKLHDELFENPPRDGIARVRMYFHRAIHDDVKLYGTGPWKYWGHGWGVEFGFDPKNVKNPNLYQKGYTIERAYGRDFCKDAKNCRPPDANFFKSIPRVINRRSVGK